MLFLPDTLSATYWLCLLCFSSVFAITESCLSRVLRVCELFVETIGNMFGCGCYFVVECYGSGWR